MTTNHRKIRTYDPETEDKRTQLLARRGGLCDSCNFGLLCLLKSRVDAKLYYFRATFGGGSLAAYNGISMRRQMRCISDEDEP